MRARHGKRFPLVSLYSVFALQGLLIWVISLPLQMSEEGLPIGIHLIAPLGREDTLLRVASQLEQAHPWVDRVPAFEGAPKGQPV